MTLDEIIYAFNSGVPVTSGDITYQYVDEIILKKGKGGNPPFYQGKMMSYGGRSVTVVSIERIDFAKEEVEQS